MDHSNNFAYLLGAYLGDGCCYVGNKSYQFSITSSDKDLCEICSDIIYEEIGKKGNIKTIYKQGEISYHQLVVCSKYLVFDLINLTSNRSKIPKFIIENSELYKPCIQGIMDADGWISKVHASDGYLRYRVGLKNTSSWVSDAFNLIHNCNVRTGMLRTSVEKHWKPAQTFSINTYDYCKKIGFRISRKANLAEEHLEWRKNGGNRKKNIQL